MYRKAKCGSRWERVTVACSGGYSERPIIDPATVQLQKIVQLSEIMLIDFCIGHGPPPSHSFISTVI